MRRWTDVLRPAILIAALIAAWPGGSPPAEAQDSLCPNGFLSPGTGGDLEITKPCSVRAGTYKYRNVNIWGGGVLTFLEDAGDDKKGIHFWATSILVEDQGSLIAGKLDEPIGKRGGSLTIHLYGRAQDPGTGKGDGGRGITCKTGHTCGVPEAIWNSNWDVGQNKPVDPRKARKIKDITAAKDYHGFTDDYFYPYHPLPYDDGDHMGYFGYKVLAVSHGGTLQLLGWKGATYCSSLTKECVDASDTRLSWVRLNRTAKDPERQLTVDRAVDGLNGWKGGDKIVVTTTDYLPGHSEELTIAVKDNNPRVAVIDVVEPLKYLHNGERYRLVGVPARIGLDGPLRSGAETRAAVALLTRSIRIVSEGDELDQPLPPDSYFGGHTLVRQGFKSFMIQGVEFYQLGQGGRLGHYPVHFHHARRSPGAFVKDSSIHDSMTRWIVLHGTQDVVLARNVGYKSIGHGYYLEDATEINNQLIGNIGILARAAVDNAQNPRKVPGILAAPDLREIAQEAVPFRSDYDHPTVFWITNGWNDFQYNMAAGATACGVCYWLLPAANSGMSIGQKWESYASMQDVFPGRAAMTPLKSFIGNSCTTAMMSFNTVGDTAVCHGVGNSGGGFPFLLPIENPLVPRAFIGDKVNPEAEKYFPRIDRGGGRFATQCDLADCSSTGKGAPGRCSSDLAAPDNEKACRVTVLDHYTTSFHWAEFNFAALWLRPQWYLVTDSVITDVQQGGLNFVTGGGYSAADRINGHWALVRKSVFIGQTQDRTKGKENPFAVDGGPFNPDSPLLCEGIRNRDNFVDVPGDYCLVADEGVTYPISNFGMSQRLFSVYDGPAYQDSNAYLSIRTRSLEDCKPFLDPDRKDGRCDAFGTDNHVPVNYWTDPTGGKHLQSHWLAGRIGGLPKDREDATEAGACYMPNAAIAWKQPNGFFYPPSFHSRNLFFDDVEIRHFVIEPLFVPGSFTTDTDAASRELCVYNPTQFNGFTDIDRQTVLNDDDGSLTGYKHTISVNLDPFFTAPIEAVECRSDNTAKTSAYDYVSTVVYPRCATLAEDNPERCAVEPPKPPAPNPHTGDWDRPCSNEKCYGIPLTRQLLTKSDAGVAKTIRMMGQAVGQRNSLTVDRGIYYVDTTVDRQRQIDEACANLTPNQQCSITVFRKDQIYYLFMLYAKPTTKQTYLIYVGREAKFDGDNIEDVWMTQADIRPDPISFTKPRKLPGTWKAAYDPDSGVLRVNIDLSDPTLKAAFDNAAEPNCRPFTYCTWDPVDKKCNDNVRRRYEPTDAVCRWAVVDPDCPSGGCFGIGFRMPPELEVEPRPDPPKAECFPKTADWNVSFSKRGVERSLGGDCTDSPVLLPDFCPVVKTPPRR